MTWIVAEQIPSPTYALYTYTGTEYSGADCHIYGPFAHDEAANLGALLQGESRVPLKFQVLPIEAKP